MSEALVTVPVLERQEAGYVKPVANQAHAIRLQIVNRPGALTGVVQVFALLNVNLETFNLEARRTGPSVGDVTVAFFSDERTCDLVCRKLGRLLEVLEVRHIPPETVPDLPATPVVKVSPLG